MTKREATSDKLARVLLERYAQEGDERLKDMAQKAREGYYDDFKSQLALPLHQLVYDLARINNCNDIVKMVVDGEFDAQVWEVDEWAQSEEGQEIFRRFLGREK